MYQLYIFIDAYRQAEPRKGARIQHVLPFPCWSKCPERLTKLFSFCPHNNFELVRLRVSDWPRSPRKLMAEGGFEPGSFRSQHNPLTTIPSWLWAIWQPFSNCYNWQYSELLHTKIKDKQVRPLETNTTTKPHHIIITFTSCRYQRSGGTAFLKVSPFVESVNFFHPT